MGDKVAAHGDRRVEELRRRSEDACRRVLILIHLSEDTEEEEDGERIISFVMAWICVVMWRVVTWISCGGGGDVFCFVRWMWRVDVDCRGGCGWNAWLCVSMDASRECAPENCAVCALRSAVCTHASGLSSMCPSVYAMLWCYGRGFFRCMEARELVGCI